MDSLGKLPKSLAETYSHILEAMRQGTALEWDVTRRSLMWIMCSPKLLTKDQWTELSYWPSPVPVDGLDSLLQLCRNLVTWDSQLMVIKFPHLSVQEYLDSLFDSVDTNTMAAGRCLLMLDPVLPGSSKIPIDYAIKYWPYHVDRSYSPGRHLAKDLLDQLNKFLGPPNIASQAFRDWLPKGIRESVIKFEFERECEYECKCKLRRDPDTVVVSPLWIASYFNFGGELHHQWACDGIELSNKDEDGLPVLLEVACSRGNETVVKILLGNVLITATNWGNCQLRRAIVNGYGGIAVQLMNSGIHHRNTDYQAILEMAAFGGNTTVMKAFVDSNPRFQITEEILIAAASRQESDVLDFLLETRFHAEITEEIMVAAAKNNPNMLETLLDRSPTIQVTEVILIAVANRQTDSYKFLESLLARSDDIQITEAILIAVLSNIHSSCSILMLLLPRCPSIQITADVLIAVADKNRYYYSTSDWAKMSIKLLTLSADVGIGEKIMVAFSKGHNFNNEIMTLLLTRCPDNQITEGIVITFVGKHQHPELINKLLAKNLGIEVTNSNWCRVVESLLT